MPTVGVLALQGGFRNHVEVFERLGHSATAVRNPADLDDVEALVLPGGESTTIGRLLVTSGLLETLSSRLRGSSLALMGTCAGMILSASTVEDGVPGQPTLNAFDATVRRNGVGPQRVSFESDLDVEGFDTPFTAVFIRPPVVERVADGVEVLAGIAGKPVLCAQGSHLFSSFHPEMTHDARIHEMFLERAGIARPSK